MKTLIETIDKIRALRKQADEEWVKGGSYDPCNHVRDECDALLEEANALEEEMEKKLGWR